MPIEIHALSEQDVELTTADLVDAQGKPTLETEAIAGFLRTVDFTPLFDAEELKSHVKVEGNNNDVTSIIEGGAVAHFMDERDALAMLKLHLREEFPSNTLAERSILSLFQDMLDEDSDPTADARRMKMIQEVAKRSRIKRIRRRTSSIAKWRWESEVTFPGFEKVNEAWPNSRRYNAKPNVRKKIGIKRTAPYRPFNTPQESREVEEGFSNQGAQGSIQHHNFHDGGFVLHKVRVGNNHYSAWFSKEGKLKDAEPGHGAKVRHVGSNVRTELERVGQRYMGRKESKELQQESAEGASMASLLCEGMSPRTSIKK
jgi:hypothetical protein